MVRVGGGWDTLDHYLATHDPCKINEYTRTGSQVSKSRDNKKAGGGEKFLFMQSR